MSPHNVSFNGNQKSCDRMAWKVWNTEDPLPRLVCCYRLSLTLNVGEWGDKSHVCICYIPFVNTYVHKTDTWIFKTYLMLYFVDLTGSAKNKFKCLWSILVFLTQQGFPHCIIHSLCVFYSSNYSKIASGYETTIVWKYMFWILCCF